MEPRRKRIHDTEKITQLVWFQNVNGREQAAAGGDRVGTQPETRCHMQLPAKCAHLHACHAPEATSIHSSHSCRPSEPTPAEAAKATKATTALPPLPLSPEGPLPPPPLPSNPASSLQPPPPRALHRPRQKTSVGLAVGRAGQPGRREHRVTVRAERHVGSEERRQGDLLVWVI